MSDRNGHKMDFMKFLGVYKMSKMYVCKMYVKKNASEILRDDSYLRFNAQVRDYTENFSRTYIRAVHPPHNDII